MRQNHLTDNGREAKALAKEVLVWMCQQMVPVCVLGVPKNMLTVKKQRMISTSTHCAHVVDTHTHTHQIDQMHTYRKNNRPHAPSSTKVARLKKENSGVQRTTRKEGREHWCFPRRCEFEFEFE